MKCLKTEAISEDSKMTRDRCGQAGFTLIELMIVVVIIGILSAIVYPSYMSYVKNTHRTAVKGQMVEFAQALERYRSRSFSYQGATTSLVPELNNSDDYSATLTLSSGNQAYVIKATPKNLMADDGVFKLNSDGDSCYVKGASDCSLSAGSSWE